LSPIICRSSAGQGKFAVLPLCHATNLSDIPEAKWVFPNKGGIGLCDISFDEASVLQSLEKNVFETIVREQVIEFLETNVKVKVAHTRLPSVGFRS